MRFDLRYICDECKKDHPRYDFYKIYQPFPDNYHFYYCCNCNRKVNYYKLLIMNRDRWNIVIELIIYNIAEKMTQKAIKEIIDKHYLGYHKEIKRKFNTTLNSIRENIDIYRIMDKIKLLENNKKIIYPDIKTLKINSDLKISDIEDEIYNIIAFDYGEYVLSLKVDNLINKNNDY